eukprot:354208-Chlamydomonas_euryale.AAC.7
MSWNGMFLERDQDKYGGSICNGGGCARRVQQKDVHTVTCAGVPDVCGVNETCKGKYFERSCTQKSFIQAIAPSAHAGTSLGPGSANTTAPSTA